VSLERTIEEFTFTPVNTAAHASLMVARAVGIAVNDGLPETGIIKRGTVQGYLNRVIIHHDRLAIKRDLIAWR